jgi:acylphosphatase
LRQLHAVIRGRVQGVGFRYNAREAAQRLSLNGWVRNLADGTVETVAVGPQNALETYLNWLHEGPPGARVAAVDADWADSSQTFTTFEIRHGYD